MTEIKYELQPEQLQSAIDSYENLAEDVSSIASFFKIAKIILPFVIVPTLLTIAATLICPEGVKKLVHPGK